MDFKEHLKKQLRFLETSCNGYDSGNKDEAIRIATTLRILFHDTKNSTSLLKHLNSRNIQLLSTGEDIPADAKFFPNLTVMQFSPILRFAEFAPKLETARTKRLVPLARWWASETVYILHPNRVAIKRKDLILCAANKDGGAHVDTAFDLRYQKLLDGADWKITLNSADGSGPIDLPFKYGHLSALRQIGYEVLNSPALLDLQN